MSAPRAVEPIPWPRRWCLVLRDRVLATGTHGDVLRELYRLPAGQRERAELRVAAGRKP